MSTKKKTNKTQFWLVVLGLFFAIGLVIGGTYVLNDQGLISSGEMSGERPDGPPTDFEEGAQRPVRADFENENQGMGFNAQALQGMFQVMLQIAVVVLVVVVSQQLYTWLIKLLPRSKTA